MYRFPISTLFSASGVCCGSDEAGVPQGSSHFSVSVHLLGSQAHLYDNRGHIDNSDPVHQKCKNVKARL